MAVSTLKANNAVTVYINPIEDAFSGTITVEKINGIVMINSFKGIRSGYWNVGSIIATVPIGFRPIHTQWCCGAAGTMAIDREGNVKVDHSALVSPYNVSLNFAYACQ